MDYNENQNIDSTQSESIKNDKTFKETFKQGSPDEVRDKVKDVVQKGVAAVAGALKGFADTTQKEDVAGSTKSAIHQAGETTRTTVSSVTDEVKNLREPLKEAGQKLSEAASGIRSTAKEQLQSTKQAVKGSGSTGMSAGLGSSIGSSDLDMTSSYNKEGSGVIGSTGLGTELPDISNTPLGQSDKKLQGKDVSSEYLDE